MTIEGLPICDAGRCSVILQAVAQRNERVSDGMAKVIAEAIEAVLADVGVDHANVDVRAALGRHLSRLAGPGVSPGPVG